MMNAGLFYCETCDKTFSGHVPYEQHIASQKHKNKLLSKQIRTALSNDDQLKCEPCQMVFTGPAPYREHMASAGHAKRASGSTSVGQATRGETSTKAGCVSCGISSFANNEEVFAHFGSREHCERNKELAVELAPKMCPSDSPGATAANQEADGTPLVYGVVPVCRADEDFAEFCKKHNFFS